MRRKDRFDDFAETCVFEDEVFGKHLENSDDGELAIRLAELARQYFGDGLDTVCLRCVRSYPEPCGGAYCVQDAECDPLRKAES